MLYKMSQSTRKYNNYETDATNKAPKYMRPKLTQLKKEIKFNNKSWRLQYSTFSN